MTSRQIRSHTKEQQMRTRLAQEAAHILVDSGNNDYYAAKRKAALHLGSVDTRNMPSNAEIETALQEYQRIFRADSQPQVLRELRKAAIHAMQFFNDFKPRLVGNVLSGSADQYSKVTLHLIASTVEDVDLYLVHHNIPFKTGEKRVRYNAEEYKTIPAYQFLAESTAIEILIFLEDGPHQAPLSSVDGRPMQRGDIAAVQKLLEE